MTRCCWWVMRPTTRASALMSRTPAACTCRALWSVQRFLGLELTPGALDGAEGLVAAAGLMARGGSLAQAA